MRRAGRVSGLPVPIRSARPGSGEVVPGRSERLEAAGSVGGVRGWEGWDGDAQKSPGTTSSDCSAKAASVRPR